MRHPGDARKKSSIIHAGRGCLGEAKHDFRLDFGFGQGRERKSGAEIVQSTVVDVTPDRRVHAVFVPQPAIGKADFSTHRLVALRDAQAIGERRHLIGVVEGKNRIARRERWDLAPTIVKRCANLVRDLPQGRSLDCAPHQVPEDAAAA